MAKKIAVKRPEPANPLTEAIKAVKHLQAFIQQHGGVEPAIEAVDRVDRLIQLTGGVAQLKSALTIVGADGAEPTVEV